MLLPLYQGATLDASGLNVLEIRCLETEKKKKKNTATERAQNKK